MVSVSRSSRVGSRIPVGSFQGFAVHVSRHWYFSFLLRVVNISFNYLH